MLFSDNFLKYLTQSRRRQKHRHGSLTHEILELAQSAMCQADIVNALGCSRQLVSFACKNHGIHLARKPKKIQQVKVDKPEVAIKRWLRAVGYKYCPNCFGVYCRAEGVEKPYCPDCTRSKALAWMKKRAEYLLSLSGCGDAKQQPASAPASEVGAERFSIERRATI